MLDSTFRQCLRHMNELPVDISPANKSWSVLKLSTASWWESSRGKGQAALSCEVKAMEGAKSLEVQHRRTPWRREGGMLGQLRRGVRLM